MIKTERHLCTYVHFFSKEIPVYDNFPPEDAFRPFRFNDTSDTKLSVWKIITKFNKTPPIDYYYHGMYMKLDNFGRWYFKGIDKEVERAWNAEKLGNEYGI